VFLLKTTDSVCNQALLAAIEIIHCSDVQNLVVDRASYFAKQLLLFFMKFFLQYSILLEEDMKVWVWDVQHLMHRFWPWLVLVTSFFALGTSISQICYGDASQEN
jgi:hypothetical protein